MLAVHDGQQLRARVILVDAVDLILLVIFNASAPKRSLGPVVLLDADGHAAILIIYENRVVEAEREVTTLRVLHIHALARLARVFPILSVESMTRRNVITRARLARVFKLVFPVLSGENTSRRSIILIDRLQRP